MPPARDRYIAIKPLARVDIDHFTRQPRPLGDEDQRRPLVDQPFEHRLPPSRAGRIDRAQFRFVDRQIDRWTPAPYIYVQLPIRRTRRLVDAIEQMLGVTVAK